MPPSKKEYCLNIWCLLQRENIVENHCDLLGFKCFQRLLSTYAIYKSERTVEHFINHWAKILCTFKPGYSPENRRKWQILTWNPRVRFMPSNTESDNILLIFATFHFGHSQCCNSTACWLESTSDSSYDKWLESLQVNRVMTHTRTRFSTWIMWSCEPWLCPHLILGEKI